MTLKELANLVCLKAHRNDSMALSEAKAYLRARYEMIWNAFLWRDSLCEVLIPAVDLAPEMILPGIVDRVVSVIYDDRYVPVESLQVRYRIHPNRIAAYSYPTNYNILAPSAVSACPDGGLLKLTADDPDATGKVSIRGLYGSADIRETITLDGLAYVFTENPFDVVLSLSKDSTDYAIEVYSQDDRLLLELPPAATSQAFQRIALDACVPKPLCVLAKRTIKPLIDDGDAPELTGIDNALLAAAIGDLLEGSRQYGKAQAKFQESGDLVKQMTRLEREQSASEFRIIPTGVCEDYDPYS